MIPRILFEEVTTPLPCDGIDCCKQATKRAWLGASGADVYLCEEHFMLFDMKGLLRKDINSIMFEGRSIYELTDEELAKEIHTLEVVATSAPGGEFYLTNLQEALRLQIKRKGNGPCSRNTAKDR
jgi:hypothetical protein